MKQHHPAVRSICQYCEHACAKRPEGTVPSFRDVLPFDEAAEILCRFHHSVTPTDTCLRFSFDPTKYAPPKPLPLPRLSPEDIIS